MTQPRGFPSRDELYEQDTIEKLPWYWPALDPDLQAALVRHGLASGRMLDLGTGPGTQAIALAERGFTVTASDLAAIAHASRKARERGVTRDVRAGRHPGLASHRPLRRRLRSRLLGQPAPAQTPAMLP